MDGKKQRIILLIIGVFFTAIFALIFIYTKGITTPSQDDFFHSKPKIHLAGNPKVSLSRVTAKVIYFIPADLRDQALPDWESLVEKTMQEEQHFFNFALDDASVLAYDIYPKLVVGQEDHFFYDSTSTDHGNPHALVTVRQEIMQRIFSENGDLHNTNFSSLNNKEYNFILIVYGYTGASAMIFKEGANQSEDVVAVNDDGPPAIILSSAYLSSPVYREFGSTILAHEIGHAYGLSDGYDTVSGKIFSSDLMGEGRDRILTTTYISDENKKQLGL